MELSAADEEYLSAHPAVHDVIECIVLECLRARPDDVQRHIASFVGKNLARSVSLSRSAVACRREGFTLEEVGRHNSEEDAWIAVRGKVYECTHFFSEHPGGKAELLRGIGKDATELFNAAHSHVSPDKRLGPFYLGPLLDGDATPAAGADESKEGSGSPTTVLPLDAYRPFLLLAKEDVGHRSVKFTFELPEGNELGLVAGQALFVQVDVGGKRMARPYTPVSMLHQRDFFEIVVKVYEEGNVSKALSQVHVGQHVHIRGPIGKMVYSNGTVTIGKAEPKRVRKFVLLAGGSGVTPMLQLMRAVVEAGDDVQLSLLDSNTERESVIAQEYIDELVGAHANLHVHYFITRGAPGDGMSEGHITAEAIRRCGFEPDSDTMVCICGPPSFVRSMKSLSGSVGHSPDAIFSY